MSREKYSTLLLLKLLLAWILILNLTSCNLKPLHSKKTSYQNHFENDCDGFKVNPVNFDQIGQRLRYSLQDGLRNRCAGKKQYKINVELEQEKESVGLQKDREITRYNVFLTANYKLYESGNNKPVLEGSRKLGGGFDAVVSDYGTYAQEQDTYLKLSEELARDLALKISGYVRNYEADKVKK